MVAYPTFTLFDSHISSFLVASKRFAKFIDIYLYSIYDLPNWSRRKNYGHNIRSSQGFTAYSRSLKMNILVRSLRNNGQLLSSELGIALRGAATTATAAGNKPVVEKDFLIYRWNPDNSNEAPRYQTYKVDINS